VSGRGSGSNVAQHEVVVLGGGPGGYATAFRAAARGLDVALVEEDQVGGTCLHRGCIPSKALLHVAGVLDEIHRAEVLGLKVHLDGLDGDGLAAFRDGVVTKLHKGLALLVEQRTTVYPGRGRVIRDDDGLAVEVTRLDGGTQQVRGGDVVLATGSVPRSLPGVHVDGEVVLTSNEALRVTEPPGEAVIIGGGAIGVEFASMWDPMGSHVTLVEALDHLLPLEDTDASQALERAYRRRGIDVLTGAQVHSVEVTDGRAQVSIEIDGTQRSLTADAVLVAIGRAPNTGGAGIEELGVLDDGGYVRTDAFGATEIDGLWAVGDVRPTLALAHAAFAEGSVVADRIAGVPDVLPVDHVHTPRVTYSHPEVASVGLTEAEARQRHGQDAIAVTTSSLRGNAKGIIAGSDGFVKGGSPGNYSHYYIWWASDTLLRGVKRPRRAPFAGSSAQLQVFDLVRTNHNMLGLL